MKKFGLTSLFAALFTLIQVNVLQAQALGPRPSQKAIAIQKVGITDIRIDYSRPAVKGRKIWGSRLVPYKGRFPWRAGANENTVIEFANDVLVEGKLLKAGKYGLHMLPAKDSKWTVMFSKKHEAWGSFRYNKKEDALRVKVQPVSREYNQEFLLYQFTDLTSKSATVALDWEKLRIPIKIEIANNHEIVLNDFRNKLQGAAGFTWRGWAAAVSYCVQNNINLDEALTWANRAIRVYPKWDTYTMKTRVLRKLGRTAEADSIDQVKIYKIAKKNELNNYGYFLLGQKKYKEAIGIFEMNVKRDPKDPNILDSLAEGHMVSGNKKKAIRLYKKVLTMNPSKFLKNNATQNLKKMGAK